jgi:hypothetical protein
MKKIPILFSAILLIFSAAGVAGATSMIAFTNPGTLTENIGEGTSGIKFTPTQNINIISLGYFDGNSDGLKYTHSLGIYDFSTHKLIDGSATAVGPGTSDTLVDSFRYASLTAPVQLLAGSSYIVVGYDFVGDGQAVPAKWADVILAPAIGPVEYLYSTKVGGLDFPTIPYCVPYFGPNLQFETAGAGAPVPEPATMLLVGSGLVGLVGFGRKKLLK